ncbi:hypothetical protein OM076_38255 [Solirubrobacter ginsenosidimutans]|uniref:DUF4367 domain-containing protein n=1 Tax=Solirubrobacter ginsenosidimutans TaxID=490573 RepID=A0A9X3S7L6_9ACTN|nr:hypothetical protein [Solirubrobacter ginsenosidimutans]MDA0166171.1 hypothetical protein [Solirubrobacter ginsenosidimutans]
MSDLETALRELDVEWPDTPDLSHAVQARIAERRRKVSWRARIAYFAAALVLLGGGTLAVSPAARSSVLEWLGLKSVEIKREAPKPVIGRELDLGTPLAAPPKGTRIPQALGAPDTAYDTILPDGTHTVSLVYTGPPKLLIQVFRARATPFIEKTLGQGATAERVANGYWITGAHGFAYQSAKGFGYEQQRLADRTLLIERDGLLIRVEGNTTKARALAIAASIH